MSWMVLPTLKSWPILRVCPETLSEKYPKDLKCLCSESVNYKLWWGLWKVIHNAVRTDDTEIWEVVKIALRQWHWFERWSVSIFLSSSSLSYANVSCTVSLLPQNHVESLLPCCLSCSVGWPYISDLAYEKRTEIWKDLLFKSKRKRDITGKALLLLSS